MPTVVYRHSKPGAVDLVRQVVGRVTLGGAGDALAREVLLPGAVALLSQVQQSFLVKAKGGTGADGIRWPPLSPKTIARRRTTRDELKALGITGKRVRGFLTPAEDKRWRQIFGTRLAALLARGVGLVQAKGIAARIAWATVKGEGAKTKLAVLGGRNVPIGIDTALSLRSLTPGVDGPSGNPDQVCEVAPGRITVGTKRPQMERFHRGGGRNRQPARELWRTDGTLPPSYAQAVLGAVGRSLLRAVAGEVQRGG